MRAASAASLRHDRAAVAQRAEILGRIEAERAARRRSCRPAVRPRWRGAPGTRPRRCARWWRDGDALERVHVGGLAVEMHRQDRARARRDRGRGRVRIERQPLGIDVGEHRPRAGHHDGERRVGRRERRRDHLVARADVERAQDQRDRVGAGADADGVRAPAGGRELALRTPRLPGRARTSRWRSRDRSPPCTAAASSPGSSALNGIVMRRRYRRIEVAIEVLAVERERARKPFAQRHGRRPAGRRA